MRNLIIGFVAGMILATIGGFDYEDELKQEALYCENMQKGLWYDSPERYAKICPVQSGHLKNILPEGETVSNPAS